MDQTSIIIHPIVNETIKTGIVNNSRTDGVKLEASLAVSNLLEYGHIKAKEGGYVLTALGKTIGQGMLSMFPEYFKLTPSGSKKSWILIESKLEN